MEYKNVLKKVGVGMIVLILSLSLGIYSGMKNSEHRNFEKFSHPSLLDEVEVYRDEFGVPSIIANNLHDLLFVQGYEITRDRTFQMEYYRSLINGEFSRILGDSMLDTDISLRTMGLKRAAIGMLEKLDTSELAMVSSYTDGINAYFGSHEGNQAMELQLLGVKAKPWDMADSVAMGSLVAFTWALGGMGEELLRLDLIREFGSEKALELFPVQFPLANDYLQNLDHELLNNSNTQADAFMQSLEPIFGNMVTIVQNSLMSNNWVISGSHTETGNPIVANDPHQGLAAPGIWYRVNLYLRDGSLFLQGLTFPGIPLITFGHNNHVAWGITAGLHDSTDLFYLKQNGDGTEYLVNNTDWVPFKTEETTIEIKGEPSVVHEMKFSEFGPMIETEEGEMAIRWTLHEGYERDLPIKSLINFNMAKNVDEFHEALEYLLTGFNFVFADVQGNIASQVSGFLPIRTNGYGLLPQNGSNGQNDWLGIVPYDEQYYVKNPIDGYLVTANERVDDRELVYYGESFAHRYRDDRISQIIENGTDFEINPNSITVEDNRRIQIDVKTLVPEDILDPIMDILQNYQFNGDNAELIEQIINDLDNWDRRLDKDSVSATVFVTYRYLLSYETFADELGENMNSYYYGSIKTIGDWLVSNRENSWFDNINTNKIENANDIVVLAISETVEYLLQNYGENTENWQWGDLHLIYMPHALDSVTDIFNIGGDPTPGGVFTILSTTEHGRNSKGEIDFTSSKAPYFRFVAEVEPTWDEVWGAVSSGVSGNPLSAHYSDSYESWVNLEFSLWLSSIEDIEDQYTLSAVFIKEGEN